MPIDPNTIPDSIASPNTKRTALCALRAGDAPVSADVNTAPGVGLPVGQGIPGTTQPGGGPSNDQA